MGANGSKADAKSFPVETLADHTKAISCMCLSEDGSLLITGSDDFSARMWSTKTRNTECLGVLTGHSGFITCLAMHETYVLTGSSDNTLRKWDMTSCECLYVYEGHTNRILRLICTGSTIFSTSYDKTAKAWRFDTSDLDEDESPCIRTFSGHTKPIYPIIFIPGVDLPQDDESDDGINPGDIVITGSADTTAKSWSFETGGCLKTFKGHKGAVSCMTTDGEGKMLYTGSMDATIRSWDITTARCIKVFEGHENGIMTMQVVKNMLYSAGMDGLAKSWVTEFGDCTRTYKGHKHSVPCMKFYRGLLLTGCGDTLARAYDAKSGSLRRIFRGHNVGITCLAVVDGYLFTGDGEGVLMKWDVSNIADDLKSHGAGEPDVDTGENKFYQKQDKRLQDVEARLDNYMETSVNAKTSLKDEFAAHERAGFQGI